MQWTRTRIGVACGSAAAVLALAGVGLGVATAGGSPGSEDTALPSRVSTGATTRLPSGTGGTGGTGNEAGALITCLQDAGIDLDLSSGLPSVEVGQDSRGFPQLTINGTVVPAADALAAGLSCRSEMAAFGALVGNEVNASGLLQDALPEDWQAKLGELGSCALSTGPAGAADDIASWAKTLATCAGVLTD